MLLSAKTSRHNRPNVNKAPLYSNARRSSGRIPRDKREPSGSKAIKTIDLLSIRGVGFGVEAVFAGAAGGVNECSFSGKA